MIFFQWFLWVFVDGMYRWMNQWKQKAVAPCIEENCQSNAANSHLSAAFSAGLGEHLFTKNQTRWLGHSVQKSPGAMRSLVQRWFKTSKPLMGWFVWLFYVSNSYGFLWMRIKIITGKIRNPSEKRLRRFKPQSGKEYPGLQCWPRSPQTLWALICF